jgi:hypothetical protein
MNWPLRTRLTPPAFDRWFSWATGFALLAACTTLVLLASPGLDLFWAFVLVASLAAGWVVLGRLLPRR